VFQLFAWLLYRKLETQEAAVAFEETAVLADIAGGSNTPYNFASSLALALLASTMSSKGR
jgi:mannose/fructose-specific phosphotransferase system component IIA